MGSYAFFRSLQASCSEPRRRQPSPLLRRNVLAIALSLAHRNEALLRPRIPSTNPVDHPRLMARLRAKMCRRGLKLPLAVELLLLVYCRLLPLRQLVLARWAHAWRARLQCPLRLVTALGQHSLVLVLVFALLRVRRLLLPLLVLPCSITPILRFLPLLPLLLSQDLLGAHALMVRKVIWVGLSCSWERPGRRA